MTNHTPTPHISAQNGDFANTVIMPGDPLRSKLIAETFLTDITLVNNVRGVQGYTGFYKGKRVSVMASGMGNPSMGIYAHELFAFYGVQNIIRVGSTGAFSKDIKLKEIIIADKVYTHTNFDNFFAKTGGGFVAGNEELVAKATKQASDMNLVSHVGATLCSDTFYNEGAEAGLAKEHGLLAVEMEGAALYLTAKKLGKRALVICTVSDNLETKQETTSLERQTAFTDMMKLALELAE